MHDKCTLLLLLLRRAGLLAGRETVAGIDEERRKEP